MARRPSRSSSRSRHAQHRGGLRPGLPAQQRLDARQQLGEGEGLGEVVVAAGAQALHAVVHRAERAQHQHRRGAPLLPQQLHDGEPVEMRQHAVGDDDVVVRLGGAKQAVPPVGGMIDRVAALAQPLQDEVRGFFVILDEQQTHAGTTSGHTRIRRALRAEVYSQPHCRLLFCSFSQRDQRLEVLDDRAGVHLARARELLQRVRPGLARARAPASAR